MYKNLSALFLATILAACSSQGSQDKDWVQGEGCEKYFSETPRELANCKDYTAAKTAKLPDAPVSLEKAGTRVDLDQGLKENE